VWLKKAARRRSAARARCSGSEGNFAGWTSRDLPGGSQTARRSREQDEGDGTHRLLALRLGGCTEWALQLPSYCSGCNVGSEAEPVTLTTGCHRFPLRIGRDVTRRGGRSSLYAYSIGKSRRKRRDVSRGQLMALWVIGLVTVVATSVGYALVPSISSGVHSRDLKIALVVPCVLAFALLVWSSSRLN
jgi:hypothetical protein